VMLFLLFTSLAFAQDLPPKVLYHIGQKPFLLEDAKLGNIPQDIWDDKVMGNNGRYQLAPFRRGLYGGAEFDNLELYGNLYFGKEQMPWVLKITLKDSCLTPEASTDTTTDPRYVDWTIAHLPEIMQTAQKCVQQNNADLDCKDVLTGFNLVANGNLWGRCERIQLNYLDDIHAKVVKDNAWGNSWFIRDRNCIEKLEASPQNILEILAEAKWDRQSRAGTYSSWGSGAYGGTLVSLLWGALTDQEKADPALLKQILGKAKNSDITGAFEKETPAGQDLWIREHVPILLQAYKDCDKNGRLDEFKSLGRKYEKNVQLEDASNTEKFLTISKYFIGEAQKRCAAP
jgi:hypothetical protein